MTKHPPRDAQARFWRPNRAGAPPSAGRAQAGSQGRWSVRKCSIGCGRWAADSDYGVGYHFDAWREAMDYAMRATSTRTDACTCTCGKRYVVPSLARNCERIHAKEESQ